ncbi:guanine nucleotide-binding protein subunit gamma 2 isoform X1 [Triticum aestivum]|uniref:guanine nucleotide-binding protein subunit gamma 2 isoform X1 n=1 Tax=Triticum aestivum TaxID=4565 RepID=UPI001D02EC10|nr:guanine nucleotide-binding protein subunit gamma 2-like isoform X1 [Triticum aestivum]
MRGEANGGDRRPRDEEEPPQQPEEEQDRTSRPSSGQQQQPAAAGAAATTRSVGYVGKHRLSAAIQRLDQELQSLQDELNELETMEPASAACREVITSTEGKPDPLLPITSSPENLSQQQMVAIQRLRFCLAFAEAETSCVQIESTPIRMVHRWPGNRIQPSFLENRCVCNP